MQDMTQPRNVSKRFIIYFLLMVASFGLGVANHYYAPYLPHIGTGLIKVALTFLFGYSFFKQTKIIKSQLTALNKPKMYSLYLYIPLVNIILFWKIFSKKTEPSRSKGNVATRILAVFCSFTTFSIPVLLFVFIAMNQAQPSSLVSNNQSYQTQRAGIVQLQNNNFQKSIDLFNTSISLKPKDDLNYYYKAIAYICLEQPHLAVDSVNQGLELDGKQIDNLFLIRSVAYAMMGEDALAEADASRFAQKKGAKGKKEQLALLLLMSETTKDPKKNIKIISTIIERFPESGEGYFLRGKYNMNQGYYQKALEDVDLALKKKVFKDALPQLYLTKSTALLYLNRFDEALDAANQALDIKPDSYYPYFLIGEIYRKDNQKDMAKYNYNLALIMCPNSDKTAIQEIINQLS